MSAEAIVDTPRTCLRYRLEPHEAQIRKDVLAGEGIPAFVHGHHSSAAEIYPPQTRLEVFTEDAERALKILEDFESAPIVTGAPKACPGCKEESPAHFTECWFCGGDL